MDTFLSAPVFAAEASRISSKPGTSTQAGGRSVAVSSPTNDPPAIMSSPMSIVRHLEPLFVLLLPYFSARLPLLPFRRNMAAGSETSVTSGAS